MEWQSFAIIPLRFLVALKNRKSEHLKGRFGGTFPWLRHKNLCGSLDNVNSAFMDAYGSKKQDHQRWGYSTVTHMEQPVYLAIWKDLNKKKRKEHRKRLNHRNGEDGWAFPFFIASLRAFGAQAVLYVFFPLFCLFINFRQYPYNFRPFLDIFWHFLTISWHFLAISWHFSGHFLTFPDHVLAILWPPWPFLIWLNHYWTALSRLEHSNLYGWWDWTVSLNNLTIRAPPGRC